MINTNAFFDFLELVSENEASMLYINQAQEHERKGMFGDAERLYLTVNEPDLAINMYKKARKFDQMLRLVSQYRKELLKDTNLHLAQQLEMEGTLREAETYYVEAGEWQSAVNMWRANDSWDEAIRIAKVQPKRGGGKKNRGWVGLVGLVGLVHVLGGTV